MWGSIGPQRGQRAGSGPGGGGGEELIVGFCRCPAMKHASEPGRHARQAIAERAGMSETTPSQGETRTMNNNQSRREFCATAIATFFASTASASAAEKKYDPGASDTEIKLGQTVPHSGPGSLYGVLGRVGEAYFQMLNEKGGINGRKVKFLTMDDAYSAPKCVEATRRLVEQEAGAFRFARHRAADRRAQISQFQGRAAAAAQHRRLEVERSKNLQVDDGRPAALPHRSAHPCKTRRGGEAERQDRHPLPERRFRPRLPRSLQAGADRRRRHRKSDHGANLRSH